jgi:hypothetical protein
MAIFGPIWTKFRSKQLKIWPGSHFQSTRLDWIDSIGSTRSNRLQKWLPGQILSCLDLNWVQIGPKMVILLNLTWKWPILVRFGLNLGLNNLKFDQEAISNRLDSIGSTRLDWIDSIESTSKMASWSNFKLFRPKLSSNRTENNLLA